MTVNGVILNSERDIKIGQKRISHDNNRIFTVKEKTYDDRDFYTCIYEDGEERIHRERFIRVYSEYTRINLSL